MHSNWQKYLGANVPRYTSYPSALGFTDAVGARHLEEALGHIGQYEPVSLYLHIPFCKQLCWYCGCNMKVENRYERIAPYVEALTAEIDMVSAFLGGRGTVSQVHFGGGTPNTLHTSDIERLLGQVEAHFGLTDCTPVAMEIDPRLCNELQTAQLVRAGISRFSIGVQDFDADVQSAINREQSYGLVLNCFENLRKYGVDDISVDLLYGLPHQKICSFRRTVEQVISLRPDRISLFGYAHMPSRFRHQKLIADETLPSREMRTILAEDAAQLLETAGYLRVGFDHFALPETTIAQAALRQRLNRNFQGFTEDQAQNVLGLGVSAISAVHGLMVQNTKQIPNYIEAVSGHHLPVERGLIATLEEEDLGNWIKQLLCDMRASLTRYFEIIRASSDELEQVLQKLEPFQKDGIVFFEGDDLVIAENAKPLARAVVATLDPAVDSAAQFASPAV